MSGKLDGQTALVVGATSGMGRATAKLLAQEGAAVAIAGRRAGLLQELGQEIVAETGRGALGLPCDVQDREQVAGMLEATRTHFGRIDLLVYSTGINIPDRSLDRLTPAIWDRMVGTNLTGAYHCTQLAVPILRAQGGGLILYVSTGAVKRADLSGIAYQATKCGLDGIAGGAMAEEKGNGIRTTVLYPGLCDTPLVLQRPVPTPPEVMQHALQPEDVAQACLFVATLPARCHVPELVLLPSRL